MRCYGCFEEFNNNLGLCPHCGYVAGTKAEEPIFMDPGTKMRDRYTIGSTLGFGGFGVTYIAWDELLQQKVAIKEYLPGEFSTRMPGQTQVQVFNGEKTQQFNDGLKQFVDEARRLAKFQSEDGIVKIFDSFEENNTAYIVMEYLEGETLTEYLKKVGTIDEATAVAMLMPVMESLKKVHEVGLLHRDIAPDNIFLTNGGEIKLLDFGAARFATTSHSRSLTVIIKPGYSPEEQYRSRGDQGPHTDVYALSATLYKMMTGVTPPDALERRALYETKNRDLLDPPRKINKKISPVREAAILNALNVRIEDRTADIDTFIKELNAETPAKRIYGKLKRIDIYRWPMWLKVGLASVFAGIVLFGGLLATGVIHFDSLFASTVEVPVGMAIVPNVEGLKSEKAIAKIEKVGLYATTSGNVESEYVEAGKILLQSPDGELFAPIGSEVALTVSAGKKIVVNPEDDKLIMPYIVWDTIEDAQEKLAKAGFGEITIIEEYNDAVAAGQVISANLENGREVKKGTKVKVTVSKGVDPKVEEERKAKIEVARKEAEEAAAKKKAEEAATKKKAEETKKNQAETWGDWSYGSWATVQDATCTSEGREERIKTRTSSKGETESQTETRTIPKINHRNSTYDSYNRFDKVTYEDIWNARCTDCGETWEESSGSHEHRADWDIGYTYDYDTSNHYALLCCARCGEWIVSHSNPHEWGKMDENGIRYCMGHYGTVYYCPASIQNTVAHTHTWVDITETVHHDAEIHVEHHDAVTEYVWVGETHYQGHVNQVCSLCGYETAFGCDNSGPDYNEVKNYAENIANSYAYWGIAAHFMEVHEDTLSSDIYAPSIGVYPSVRDVPHTVYITCSEYEVGGMETRIISEAWDETVVDNEAWDETVVVGQKCSTCGATK